MAFPLLITTPTTRGASKSTPLFFNLMKTSGLIPSGWSLRAFKICWCWNATSSLLASRRVIVMKWSKESPFCICIPKSSKVPGLDPILSITFLISISFNINPFCLTNSLSSFSFNSTTKMIVSRLPSFPNSTEAPCAVTYRCKFFWKTLCCMNSKYTFTTSCLNFEYHRRKNSLVWDGLSHSFSKVFDCSIKFSCACGTYDLAEQVSFTLRSANFNLQDSWTTVDDSINNCGLSNSFAAVGNVLASSSLPYLCFDRCPADIIFILQELKIICGIWNSFFNSIFQLH